MNFLSPAIQLDIRSEAVTIDIAPTSRYGEQYDIARIQTAIVLAQPLACVFRLIRTAIPAASGH